MIKDIYVSFYKDTLYKFECHSVSFEFKEALEIKYGQGKLVVERERVTCSGHFGTFDQIGEIFKTYYRKDRIEAVDWLQSYYDSDCKKQLLHYFFIQDVALDNRLYKMEAIARAKEKAKQDSINKVKLNNF